MSVAQNFPVIKPSLLLDFASVGSLDPRVTFSRASSATFYGKTVAKAEENLVYPSLVSTFGVSSWVANGTSTATINNAVAPDGTTTATTIETTGAGGARYWKTFAAGTYTVSCWVRSVSGDTSFQTDFENGNAGTLTLTSSWQRHVSTQTLGASIAWIDFQIAGTGVFEIWGVQLEQRSSVTAYTPTTTQPITNYIPVLQTAAANVARFDHNPVTGESLGLLIEEQRTNLLTYSEDFGTTWANTASAENINVVVAPDGSLTGDKVYSTSGNDGYISQSPSITTGLTYTVSVYAKSAGYNSFRFIMTAAGDNKAATFDITGNGSTRLVSSGATATIIAVGNGWYRCTLTFTSVSTGAVGFRIYPQEFGITGDGYSGIYIWGAQLEAGAFPTSYIKTEASQVTRSADAASMTGANFSSWYRADEGTLFAEAISNGGYVYAQLGIGSNTNDRIALLSSSPNFAVNSGSTSSVQLGSTTLSNGAAAKLAGAYGVNNFAVSINGGSVLTDTDGLLAAPTSLLIGARNSSAPTSQLCGTIKKIAYYPKRLSNANLQALTS